MASERKQEQPTPSTSRIGPSMSASIDQSSQNAESEYGSVPDTPSHITTRGVTPGPGSPQPLSPEGAPTDDERNRLLGSNASRGSLPKLAQYPGGIKIEIPPPAAVAPTRIPQKDGPAFPARPSIYPASGPRSELDWIVPVELRRERPKILQERLSPTLETAKVERGKYELKAKMTGYATSLSECRSS